jgi:hypothetical protein
LMAAVGKAVLCNFLHATHLVLLVLAVYWNECET